MKRKIILSLAISAISAAILSACNSESMQDFSAEGEGSESYTTGSYQQHFFESIAERGSEERAASEAGNAETEESKAQTAFLKFLSGDMSVLEDQELGREWVDFYLPNSELEYVFMDLDGDDVSELVLQYVNEPGIFNAVFHYDNGKLICWDLDSVEMSSRNYPLRDGTMVHKYDYSGTQSYIVFRYLPDGSHEELFDLFAREELIYESDTVPVPYYEVDGNETDRRTFDDELYMRISSQVLRRSAWKPVENSGSEASAPEGSAEAAVENASSSTTNASYHFPDIDGLGLYNELAYNHCFVNGNVLCTAYEIVKDEHPRTAMNFYDLEKEVLEKTLYLQDGWTFEEFIGGSEDYICKMKVSHYKSNNGAVFPVDSVVTVMNDYSKEISDYTYQNASINRGGHNISQWSLDIIDTDRDMKIVEGRDSGGDGWDPEYRYQRYMFPVDGNRFVYRTGGYEWMPCFGIYDFGTDTANDVSGSQDLYPLGVHDGKVYSVKTAWDGYGGTELYVTDIETLETSLFLTFPAQYENNEYVNYFMSQNGENMIAVKEYESLVTIYSIDPDSGEITMLFDLPEYLYFNNIVFFNEDSLALKVIVNREDKILMTDFYK